LPETCRHRCLRIPQIRPFPPGIHRKTLCLLSLLVPQSVHSAMSPFRKNSVTCSFWKSSVLRVRLVRAFPKFARFVKKSTGKRSAQRRCSLHRLLSSANLIEFLIRVPFSVSSLVPQCVRSGNWLELLVRITFAAPYLTKPVRNAPLAVIPGFSRFL